MPRIINSKNIDYRGFCCRIKYIKKKQIYRGKIDIGSEEITIFGKAISDMRIEFFEIIDDFIKLRSFLNQKENSYQTNYFDLNSYLSTEEDVYSLIGVF